MSYFNASQYRNYLNRDGMDSTRANIRHDLDPDRFPRPHYYDSFGNYIEPSAAQTAPLTEDEADRHLTAVKEGIVARIPGSSFHASNGVTLRYSPTKWHRPWTVVPELAEWSAPEGDYGVGVEVELGFFTREAAQAVAARIEPWENITLDFEGGMNPIEATFPPFRFSEARDSLPIQYLNILNSEFSGQVVDHSASSMVGTHVNVSKGGQYIPTERISAVSSVLDLMRRGGMTYDRLARYFGRSPYGTCYGRGSYRDRSAQFVEFKLFNSQLNPERLLQYINIAVCLVELMCDTNRVITSEEVHVALEKGYNMDNSLTTTTEAASALAIAA